MPLGILEPQVEHVPGTVYVYDESRREAELAATDATLKRDKSGKIILVPQPSDDPNDPLNQSIVQRDIQLGILSFVAVLATTAAPLLAADSVHLANFFEKTYQNAADLTAYLLAGVAVGAVIFVPTSRVWGKRHAFLFGALLMCATSAWGGSTHLNRNYTSFLWARVFQGVALAPFESLSNAVIGDLYFVHERGPRMAFINTVLFGGAFLTPVFVGMMSAHIGWQWSFYLLSIFMGVGFLLLLFFVPETAYWRSARLNTDLASNEDARAIMKGSPPLEGRDSSKEGRAADYSHELSSSTPRRSFVQRVMPFNGRYTDESFFKLLLRPFPLYLHPAVLWGCLMQGVIIGWTVMVGVILSIIFLGPPLFLNEEGAGKKYTGAFIGSIIGLLLAALFTETTTRFLIRKNNGKYEPEFRIWMGLPTLIFTAIGFYGFGITAGNVYKYGWLIPDVFLAFIIISMVMGAIASAQYLLDAYRDIAVEIFTNLIIFKNIFSFILAHYAYTWVFKIGIREMFIIFASIEVGICLLCVPMYVFGKKNRAFFHQHDILKIARLR